MSRVILEPKFDGETKTYEFDFAADLATAETISTQNVTATVYSGTDASPSNLLSGSTTASGTVVSQNITGGTVGVIYKLLCNITTSAGQTLERSGYLAVIPDLP